MTGYQVVSLDDWSNFQDEIIRLANEGFNGTPIERLAFRGQADSTWPLKSSLDRLEDGSKAEKLQSSMIQHYCEMTGLRLPDTPEQRIAILGDMQHNGAPTRLLDWSRSPYVAAFFAASGALALQTEVMSIWVIDPRAASFTSNAGLTFYEPSARENRRAFAQRGCYTMNASLKDSLDSYWETFHQERGGGVSAVRWDIPSPEARLAVAQLSLMGTSYLALFPDPTGVAREAMVRAMVFPG